MPDPTPTIDTETANLIVADFFDALLDGLFGSDRTSTTEEAANAHLANIVKASSGVDPNKDFLMGINWMLGISHALLAQYSAKDEPGEETDSVEDSTGASA